MRLLPNPFLPPRALLSPGTRILQQVPRLKRSMADVIHGRGKKEEGREISQLFAVETSLSSAEGLWHLLGRSRGVGCSCSPWEKVISKSARPLPLRKSEFPIGFPLFGFVGVSRLSGGVLWTIPELLSCCLVLLNAPPELILSCTEPGCVTLPGSSRLNSRERICPVFRQF